MKSEQLRAGKKRNAVRPAVERLEPRKLLSAYALNTVALFNGTNGCSPGGGLVMDSSGNLFGTTQGGGAGGGYGTVFEIAAGHSAITTIASFNDANGSIPTAGVTLDSRGDLFGTTYEGGNPAVYGGYGGGTVFEIAAASGSITTIASFEYYSDYKSGVTLDSSGDLFGTTSEGGDHGDGAVFEVAAGSRSIATIASFNGANGNMPVAGVTLDSNGNLFGTTEEGGAYSTYDPYLDGPLSNGTVFEIPHGTSSIVTVASFNGTNGIGPMGGVTLDSSGDLFGTAEDGGVDVNGGGPVGLGSGTAFKIAAGSSSITAIASFNSSGACSPEASVTLDSSGDIFGTTGGEGSANIGTVFEIAAGSSAITMIASLNSSYGAGEGTGVTLDSSGDIFGTTEYGGIVFSGNNPNDLDGGTVFELTPGTPPVTNQLSFVQELLDATAATVLPVTVDVLDSAGNLLTSDNSTVSLSIASGPSGATLGGTTTATAVNGVATFNVSVSKAGSYTLTASDGTDSPATSNAFDITSPLVPSIVHSTVPPSIVQGAGTRGAVKVDILNSADTGSSGSTTVAIYASTDGTIDGSATLIGSRTWPHLKIPANGTVALGVGVPTLDNLGDGSYTLLAHVTDPSGATNVSSAGPSLTVSAATIAFSETITRTTLAPSDVSGAAIKAVAFVRVTNNGNIVSNGASQLGLFLSEDGTAADGTSIRGISRSIALKPGASRVIRVPLLNLPAVADGSYYLVAQVTDPESNVTEAASAGQYYMAAPFWSLVPTSGSIVSLANGGAVVSVIVQNQGNVPPPAGFSDVAIWSSANGSAEDTELTDDPSAKLGLAAGASRTLRLRLAPDEQSAAASDGYVLVVVTDPSGTAQTLAISD